jgi:hypothetical protein
MIALLNLAIGIIYYLYLFGEFLCWGSMSYYLMTLASPLMYQYRHYQNPFCELRSSL